MPQVLAPPGLALTRGLVRALSGGLGGDYGCIAFALVSSFRDRTGISGRELVVEGLSLAGHR